MSRDDDSSFQIRAGRTRDRGGGASRRPRSFVGQVMRAVTKAKGGPSMRGDAVIENAYEFALVPWRPVMDERLGRHISGVVRDSGVSWDFGRKRGLGIGM